MKTKCIIILTLPAVLAWNAWAQTAPFAQSITDKVICGYQGWFSCYGDGSPIARWFHWSFGQYQSDNGRPATGKVTFEVYPDVSIYPPDCLFQSGLGNLGDGRPAKLFSSWLPDVIETHFQLMEDNGIDGVALQRFITMTNDRVFLVSHDSLSARVRRAAEKHRRVFYLQYDASGQPNDRLDSLKTDWQQEIVGKLHLTSSPYYAHQDGKPVVCLWGLGFRDRGLVPAKCLEIVNWFRDQGCYVIGGVPTFWREGINDSDTGFESVYHAFNMISPWMVGRFGDAAGADWFRDNVLRQDIQDCNARGIAYQSVIFPGFAWSNWNGGPPNQIPRNRGEFLWKQVKNLMELRQTGAFLAMIDEYDEGTATLNMADSYYDIPTDQYFLTSSADGTYLSHDFYLRLVGQATRVFHGEAPATDSVTIPRSTGPIWLRTGFESRFDAMPDWSSSPDPSAGIVNVSGYGGTGDPVLAPVQENPHIGLYALKCEGRDLSKEASVCYFRAFDVDIPVYANTNLSFRTYPTNELGRHLSVDLLMTDGSTLRDAGATDVNGVNMHPGTARGIVGKWSQTTCNIGKWLNGKMIDRIMVAYDMSPETGDFRTYLDDLAIFTGEVASSVNEAPSADGRLLRLYPNPVSGARITVDCSAAAPGKDLIVTFFGFDGRVLLTGRAVSGEINAISAGNLPKGVILVSVRGEGISEMRKLIVY